MGAVSSMLSVASITMGAYQSKQEANAKRLEAELSADGLEAQALRKELEADEALKIGRLNQAEHGVRMKKELASLTASYAYSGVKVNEGSAVEAVADRAAWGEYERQKIEYQASIESWGLRYDAAMLRNEAVNVRVGGAGAGSGVQSYLGVGKQLLNLF